MRLTVTSSERWHWCLVGTYDCLLINIKVATSHMPALMFLHLSFICAGDFQEGKVAQWEQRPGGLNQASPAGQRAAWVTFPLALAGMWLCGIHPHYFHKARKPSKSSAVCGHYTQLHPNSKPGDLFNPCTYVFYCTHHLRYYCYQCLSYHFFHLTLNS